MDLNLTLKEEEKEKQSENYLDMLSSNNHKALSIQTP